MEETLRLNSPRFVVDPDVHWEWNRVALEAVGSEEEGDELGDLQGDTVFVRKLGSTGADDDCVATGLESVGNEGKGCGVRSPGLVEVDGNGEGFAHTGFQVLLVY